MISNKCPKCGYDPQKDKEKEKQNIREGKFKLEDLVTATKRIEPKLWKN